MRVPRGKCGNEGRPFQGIDTTPLERNRIDIVVGGNEGRPFQGIDTRFFRIDIQTSGSRVEMKVAPFRALTHFFSSMPFEIPYWWK